AEGNWGGGHGTHVAGVIAAQLGSGGVVRDGTLPSGGMVGVAPGVTLLVARVLDVEGNGSTSDVIAAVEWCQAQGAHVASLSLGAPERNNAEELAFARAWEAGMVTVAATGNEGTDDPNAQPPILYPAGYDTVLAVGAVRLDGTHPTFSQTGPHVDFVAPGVGVPSTFKVGGSIFGHLEAGGVSLRNEALEFSGTSAVSGQLTFCGLAADDASCEDVRSCGFVALVDRGGDVLFADKVKHVQAQGARAVIVVNHRPEEDGDLAFTLGSSDRWPVTLAVPTTAREGLLAKVGSSVRLSVQGADYAMLTGTSMATPFVSGVAALLWSRDPSLTNAQVRDLLERSAKDLGSVKGRDDTFGHGLVQARSALELLDSGI
ncbi:MAG: S8 family serine peptidase, partial [Myxococcaceae bacterium]|nr:S8 family serine peptidase [Myxococcaceae bacterium]